MNKLDAPAAYVRLGLLINQHFPGYVDGYFGPAELRTAVEAEGKLPLEDLEALEQSTRETVTADSSMPADRREFLSAELGAMRTTLQILRGDSPEIADEVQSLYGVRPEWVDERIFNEAHHVLNAILPGSEPLSRRVMEFRERGRVPGEVAAPIIRKLADILRQKTRARFNLPDEEDCAVTFVYNQPWAAYNWYLGGMRSRIEFNQDIPPWLLSLPYTVAHETYPGHHTEHALKEQHLYRHEQRLEHAILLNNTPSALISEGIATNALEAIAAPDEIAAMLVDCYEAAGLPPGEALRAKDFREAARPLGKVIDNQILLFHRNHLPEDELVAYGLRYALSDEKLERKGLEFIKDPLWRSYHFNYTLGGGLVSAFMDAGADRSKAFARLLCEPFTPGRLERSIAKCC